MEEAARRGPGDVLVFLSGEREILTAETLRQRVPDGGDPPAVRRLSTASSSASSSTPVAASCSARTSPRRRSRCRACASSSTPGSPGSAVQPPARVQRLPIEPVSQASTAQRAGRCGQLGPGICIRLFAEDDHAARPPFTEPEAPAHEPRLGDPADARPRARRRGHVPSSTRRMQPPCATSSCWTRLGAITGDAEQRTSRRSGGAAPAAHRPADRSHGPQRGRRPRVQATCS